MEGIKDIIRREMEALKGNIQKRMGETGFNASGRTSASLRVDIDGETASLVGSRALLASERGRKAGPVPQNFTGIIRQWILDKGINYENYRPKGVSASLSSEQKLAGLSGAIAFSIMKNGTVLYRKGLTRDIYSKALSDTLETIGDEATGFLSMEIETIHTKYRGNENNDN